MNFHWIARICLLAGLASTIATATPPPPGPDGGEPPPGPPPPHVQRFFEVMRQRDPEEFERMRLLRESDPEAFRAELGERLHKARARHDADGPGGEGFVPPGPPDGDRNPKRRPRRDAEGDAMRVHSPELAELESETRNLVRQLRDAPEGAERRQQLETLRETLTRTFDLRQQLRRERVDQMKQRLRDVETLLDERDRTRDQLIEKQLSALTGTDTPPP